jgi:hypothetical protein
MCRQLFKAVCFGSVLTWSALQPLTVNAEPNTTLIRPPAKAVGTPSVRPSDKASSSKTSARYSAPAVSFPDRKAVIINNCPLVELSNFKFENRHQRYRTRQVTDLSWKNASEKSIIAFEVVLLEFDPFNRRIDGGRIMITGRNSGDWRPLEPGQQSSDGFIDYREREVLTSIVYVRAVRLSDGSVWFADISNVNAQIKSALPELTELGDVDPAPRKSGPQDAEPKEGQ